MAWLLTVYFPAQAQNPHDIYDLRVGVERHYDMSSYLDVFTRTPIDENVVAGIERIIDEIEIDNQVWSIIEWVHWSYLNQPSGTYLNIDIDTLYYRVEGSILYQHVDEVPVPIFDFEITKGDSMYSKFELYLPSWVQDLFNEFEDFGGEVIVDEALVFPKGETHRVLWGDGSSSGSNPHHPIPSSETFINEILTEFEGWFYPYNPDKVDIYSPFLPFYYVEGIGSIYNIFNHKGYYMAGYKSADGHVMGKLNYVPTSIGEGDEIPTYPILHQNYPNPFNPSTVIGYELPESAHVRLSVYDLLGREVAVLVNEITPAGQYQAVFNGQNLSSGIYVYRLHSGEHLLTGKMLLMK